MEPAPPSVHPGAARAWWGVGVLSFFYLLAFVDRQILALLVEPITRDLGLSLTQFGLLHGLSFALFYTFLGIPLAYLADTRSRRGLVAAGVVAWSAMTALCGLAATHAQLFLARMGVGVGEAALSPAAFSWISASFPRERRATAIAVYSMGIYLGSGLAFAIGGQVVVLAAEEGGLGLPFLGDLRAWQAPLVLVGALGVLAAPLALTLREPARTVAPAGRRTGAPPFGALLAWMRQHPRAFLGHHAGFALLALSGYAVNSWAPYVLEAHFGLSKGDASLGYGLVLGLGGTAGIVAGGALADRWRARGLHGANVRVGTLAALAGVPFAALLSSAPGGGACLALLVPLSIATAAGFGVAAASAVELVPAALRGRATAVYLFVINLIGLGAGPAAVGWLAESVFGSKAALPAALAIVAAASGLAACALLAWSRAAHGTCSAQVPA